MVDIVQVGLSVDSRSVDKGTKSLDRLGKQGKKTETATNKMSKAFKVGMVAAVAAASAAIFKSIQLHREFTKSISELAAITGAAGDDLKFFRDQALKMGETTTFSASQVAIAFKLVASAKPELLESKEALAAVTREVLTLAEAAGLDLPEAAKALGSSLNQFNAGADQASRFINVLAAGAKFGASEINETAEAMKNVGAVASSIGLSFEQTNAAIQALASVSIKGAEAGTGLRGVLLKLAKQSRDEFNPEIVGLETALKNLKDANLTTTEKMNLFGLESATAATALISQADAVGELTKKLTGTNTATEQAAINVDNLDGDIKRMESAWEGVALMLGDTFDPALRGTVNLISFMAKTAKTVVLTFKDLGNKIGAAAAQLVSLASFDFDAITAIGEARDRNAEKLEKEYNLIWNINGALDKQKELEKIKAESGAEEAKTSQEDIELERLVESLEMKESIRMDAELETADREQAEMERKSDERDAWHDKLLTADKNYYDRLYNMETGSQKASLEFSTAIRSNDIRGALQTGALMLSNQAKQSKEGFALQKAFALANAVVTLPSAVMKSFDNGGGYPWGLIPAGLMLAQGLSQISAINSSSFNSKSSSAGVAGGGASSMPRPPTTAGAPTASALPAGATATPDALEQPMKKVIHVTVDGDGANSEAMRNFIVNLEETASNMGSDTRLVLS